MTREHHREEAEQRIRASDWQWQESHDDAGRIGSLREAVVALTEAVLALSAIEKVETGGTWPATPNTYPTTGGTL